jgi:hypothetical protein
MEKPEDKKQTEERKNEQEKSDSGNLKDEQLNDVVGGATTALLTCPVCGGPKGQCSHSTVV